MQSKVDVVGALPVMLAEVTVQVERRLNLARSCETNWENGYENRSPVLSTNNALAMMICTGRTQICCQ